MTDDVFDNATPSLAIRHPPSVVLVRPQLGENIGAVARAMSNFGLADLRLVAPKNGWPNERAVDMAASGAHIVNSATLHNTLPDALSGIQRIYATTARTRDMDKRVVDVSTAADMMHTDAINGVCPAILFGPERTGLANEDLVHADALITIPTDAANTSLNIAQAAVIIAYEWCRRRGDVARIVRDAQRGELAEKSEIEGFFSQLEGYLDEVNHFRTEDKKIVMWQNLRTIFTRAELSGQEVKTLRGMIRALFTRRIEP